MANEATPRRAFLGQLAITTAGLSGAVRGGAAVLQPGVRAPGSWDDSWTTRLGSSHRFVFDLAQEGNAASMLDQIDALYRDYQTALGAADRDVHAVLVIRHAAIPLVMGDSLWARYKLGTANPDREAITRWQGRGVTVLACDMALMNRVRNFAHDSGADEKAVEQEVRANLLPGVIVQPNGVYAINRALDAGCARYFSGA